MTTREQAKQIAKEKFGLKLETDEIMKLDDNSYDWNQLKKIGEQKWKVSGNYKFIINKSFKVKGKVTNSITPYKRNVSLIKKVSGKIDGKETEQVYYLDERLDKRYKGNIIGSFNKELYMYQYISEEREYILLSEEKLDLEEYTIEGTKIEVPDYADIGNYFKVSLKFPMIFIHTATKRIIDFKSNEDFIKYLKSIDLKENDLKSFAFGLDDKYFKHPEYFQNLIYAFMFSAKYDSSPYPLHLMIIGEPGGGKSKQLESLQPKMGEINQITDGTCSTIKILIPSFKGTTPKTGDLLQANRLVCIDEFFRILMRVDKDERENMLTYLNPLLEHKQRRFGSGNSEFTGQMTAKLLAVTNPIFGTKKINSLCNKFDTSFLSRILIWYQDEEHYSNIKDCSEDDLEEIKSELQNEDWISIYDFLNSFKAEFDHIKVKELYNSYVPSLQMKTDYEEVLNMYQARYNHHIFCLMDGIVKTRCLLERDSSFKAKEVDYHKLKAIWEKLLINWEVNIISKV